MVEFVSYDGAYPCLCAGTLVIKVNGKEYSLQHCLISGGCINWKTEEVKKKQWEIDLEELPEELKEYASAIKETVNANIPYGCCGGCI